VAALDAVIANLAIVSMASRQLDNEAVTRLPLFQPASVTACYNSIGSKRAAFLSDILLQYAAVETADVVHDLE
jgi:hypothetical protein